MTNNSSSRPVGLNRIKIYNTYIVYCVIYKFTTNKHQNPYRTEKQFPSVLQTDKTTKMETSGE